MQRTSILNRIQRHKSFVYGKARILEEGSDLAIEVDIQPRSNGRPICSGCGKARPGYDSMSQPRRFRYTACAAKFLDEWCTRSMRSKIEPMKKVAETLRRHRDLILNWFRADGMLSAEIVEGLNNKVKLAMRKAYGFRSEKAIEMALYHQLGDLPEPESTHRFC